MDVRCRIELLGRLRVVQGERQVTRFRTQKTGASADYHLARARRREVLTDILWRGGHPRADLLRLAPCPGSGRPTYPQGGRG